MNGLKDVTTRADAGRIIRKMIAESKNPGVTLLEAGRELMERTDLAVEGGSAPLTSGEARTADSCVSSYKYQFKKTRGK